MKYIFLILLFFVSSNDSKNHSVEVIDTDIRGISIVSPLTENEEDIFFPIKKINANWVALTPFAFLNSGETNIEFPTEENYWGDYYPNLKRVIRQAQSQNLKVLLKPHVWIRGEGWPGDYDLYFWQWKDWERNYEQFILNMVDVAASLNIEMFCIGVEWKIALERRPKFWKELIRKIRKRYDGKLIYAANWDEYKSVSIWKELDYVGIDGYFPLSKERTPSKNELKIAWKPILKEINKFYQKVNRPIIFTEYGYRSTDYACWKQWELEALKDNELVNLKAQRIGYEAFYESVWNQDWFAGGFIWKWYPESNSGGLNNSNYTPQGKPTLEIIENWYSETN